MGAEAQGPKGPGAQGPVAKESRAQGNHWPRGPSGPRGLRVQGPEGPERPRRPGPRAHVAQGREVPGAQECARRLAELL